MKEEVKREIMVVMPAYQAESTVGSTVSALPLDIGQIVLCDDASSDNTAVVSEKMGLTTLRHDTNRGYGGNQKTLYQHVLNSESKYIVMLHPDNQYSTDSIPIMIDMLVKGRADMILGTRMKTARKNGMPFWKWLSNRGLTIMQNKVYKTKLTEFHTGLRAYKRELLEKMPFMSFSDDFVFDSQVIA